MTVWWYRWLTGWAEMLDGAACVMTAGFVQTEFTLRAINRMLNEEEKNDQ